MSARLRSPSEAGRSLPRPVDRHVDRRHDRSADSPRTRSSRRRWSCSAIFVFYPIAAVIYYSLTDYDIVTPPVFVGLDNFARLLGDDDVLAGARALVRLSARHADPDRAVDRARHRRQSPAARDPHLPGAVFRARGERLDRDRAGVAVAVRSQRDHQSDPAVVGRHPRADPVARRRRRSCCRSRCC